MTDKYTALLAKLKEATGPFRVDKAHALAETVYLGDDEGAEYWLLYLALQSGHEATGAALALVEMTLPKEDRDIDLQIRRSGRAVVLHYRPKHRVWHVFTRPTLPLAILIAWCEAMIQKEQSK